MKQPKFNHLLRNDVTRTKSDSFSCLKENALLEGHQKTGHRAIYVGRLIFIFPWVSFFITEYSVFYTDSSGVFWAVSPWRMREWPILFSVLYAGLSRSCYFHKVPQPCIQMSLLQKDLKLKNLLDLSRLWGSCWPSALGLFLDCHKPYKFVSPQPRQGEMWACAPGVER